MRNFAATAALFLVALIFGPLILWQKESLGQKMHNSSLLLIGGILGLSYSTLWIFLLYKFLLVLGIPTFALIAFYFSNGLGQYLCFRYLPRLSASRAIKLSHLGLVIWLALITITSRHSDGLLQIPIVWASMILVLVSGLASFFTSGYFLNLLKLSKDVLDRRSIFASNMLFSGLLFFVATYGIRHVGLEKFALFGVGGYALAGLMLFAINLRA